jgi:hypothetical protein
MERGEWRRAMDLLFLTSPFILDYRNTRSRKLGRILWCERRLRCTRTAQHSASDDEAEGKTNNAVLGVSMEGRGQV